MIQIFLVAGVTQEIAKLIIFKKDCQVNFIIIYYTCCLQLKLENMLQKLNINYS